MNNMLEKEIENKVNIYARTKGVLTYKFTSPNRSSVPDRLYIFPNGKVVFIEFKREGLKPTIPQLREHKRIVDNGVPVYVIDDVDVGKALVDSIL